MKKGMVKSFEDFELHHKVIAFLAIMVLTIIITRGIVMIRDFNPIIHGYELHHFYYGVLLLMIVTLMFLFARRHYFLYLTLSAISLGLILDEFLYVAGGFGNTARYIATLPSAVIFAIVIALIITIIQRLSKR